MTHRSDNIILPPGEPMCQPSAPCGKKMHCARFIAAPQSQGAKMADYTLISPFMLTGLCGGYMSLQKTTPAKIKAPTKPAFRGL